MGDKKAWNFWWRKDGLLVDQNELEILNYVEAADKNIWSRDTALFLLKSHIKSCRLTAWWIMFLICFLVASCLASSISEPWWVTIVRSSISEPWWVIIVRSSLAGSFSLLGLYILVAEINTLKILKDALFLRQLIWTEMPVNFAEESGLGFSPNFPNQPKSKKKSKKRKSKKKSK
jgi:hypothetical protein